MGPIDWRQRDPRNTRRYVQTRRHWLAGFEGGHGTCCLCGRPVDTSLAGTNPHGPTIEHRVPIRELRTIARTWTELVALTCDTSLWALAHKRCQDRQGQAVTASINRARNQATATLATALGASRDW